MQSCTLLAVMLVLSLSIQVTAQTIISGNDISGVWTKSKSPYIVQGSAQVGTDKSLIIQPGVEVRFEFSAQLVAYSSSTIIAEGNAEEPIIFTAANQNPQPGDWSGIRTSGTSDRCSFEYCIVEYSTNGLIIQALAYGCIDERNTSSIGHCTFRYNEKSGLLVSARGSSTSGCIPFGSLGTTIPEVKQNTFHDNPGAGILVESWDGYSSGGSARPIISRNILYNNGDAIRFKGDDWTEAKILHNTIVGNEGSGITYETRMNEQFVIINNIIAQNTLGVFSLTDSVPTLGYNNVWNNDLDYQGIAAAASNIAEDPKFRDGALYDFRLNDCHSPCIDAGDPDQEPDPDGSVADIGAFPFDQALVIQISSDKTEAMAGETFEFTSTLTGSGYEIDTWQWDFGDGNTSTAANPTHTYQEKGEYDVSLIVSDSDCEFSKTKVNPGMIRILNSPPMILNIPDEIIMEEDQIDTSLIVSSLFSDADGDDLAYTLTPSEHLTVFLEQGKIRIEPDADWSGTETFNILARDEDQENTAADIQVTVLPVNDAPRLINPPFELLIEEDQTSTLNVSSLFTDPDEDPLSFTFTPLNHIEISLSDGILEGTPDKDWHGTDRLSVFASDPSQARVEAIIEVTVSAVNDSVELIAYLPEKLELEIPVDTSLSFILEARDVDSDLRFAWFVDGIEQNDTSATFAYTFIEVGEFLVEGIVRDQEFQIETSWVVKVTMSTPTEDHLSKLINDFRITPNPFTRSASIHIDLKESEPVTMSIIDVHGKTVRSLGKNYRASRQAISWDGTDEQGQRVPSGTYFCVLHSKRGLAARRVLFIR